MARAPSPISNLDNLQLRRTRAALDHHWSSTTRVIGAVLELSEQQVRLEAEYQDGRVWVGLVGASCERISRNRGGTAFVVPLSSLPQGLYAWLGLQEVWDKAGGARPFAFRHLSLTIYFGFPGDPMKHQAFRAEWPGVREWPGTGIGFQSPGAGHPHWQIDVLQTLREARAPAEFSGDSADIVADFSDETVTRSLDDLIQSITLERMHFASAAPWWTTLQSDAHPHHMNAPGDEASLTRWLAGCLVYLKQELRRCEIGGL